MIVRVANESDAQAILDLLYSENKRLPSEEGIGVVTEIDGKIVGYTHIAMKLFVDPMVVTGGAITRVRMIRAMMEFVKTVMRTNGSKHVYFTAEGDGFIRFLDKAFSVELFSTEATFRGKE